MLQRRRLLAAAAATAALRVARAAPASDDPVEVEAGVHLVPGRGGEPEAANRGRVGNAGFIVGRTGVMLIDSGVSWRHGEALLAAVARVTPQPVRLALVTHARQEFVFGAAALQARGIPVHMQRQAAELMAARCGRCLDTLRSTLGEEEMRGTTLFRPDVLFDQAHVIEVIGRPVFVQTHGVSSGPGDSSVFDVRSGTLFAGGLADNRRIPDLQDADIDGWRQALAALRTLRLNTVVPGHGDAAAPELLVDVERYLVRLQTRVAALLKAGASLGEVPDAAALPEFQGWALYDTLHRRNAAALFVRMERDEMLAPASAVRSGLPPAAQVGAS